MPATRRHAALAMMLMAASTGSRALQFPSRPIRLVVGAGVGGASDYVTRLMAAALQTELGQPMVAENRSGASGTLAAQAVARAVPDGHTLLMSGPSAIISAPHVMPRLGYDPGRDLTPVALSAAGALWLVVHPGLPVRRVQDLVAWARKWPGDLNYGSSGVGSSGHVAAARWAQQSGVRMAHVPYKGDVPALVDLMAGRIHCLFVAPNVALPHVNEGRLRLLAVTSRERMPALPEVPTLIESGLQDFEVLGWLISFAPAGTPPAVLQTLRTAMARVRATPAVNAALAGLGMQAPAHLLRDDALEPFLAAERRRMHAVLQAAGIQPE